MENTFVKPPDESVLMEILDNASVGYWDWDLTSGKEYLSPALKRMFGYEDNEIENTAAAVQELIFSEDLPEITKSFELHVKSGGSVPFSREIRCHHKNGSTVWILCKGKVVAWNGAENPLRAIGCNIDITEQKLAQESLLKSEAKYRTLVNNMQDAVYRCDLEGNLTFTTPSAVQLLGYATVEDVIGKNIAGDFYYYPEERARFLKFMKAHGKVTEFEVTLKHKDGSPLTIVTNSQFFYDDNGNVMGIEGVYHDITERKLAEQALKQSEALLRGIFEANPEGIALVVNRVFSVVNNSLCSMTGYSEKELIGQSTRILYFDDNDFIHVGEIYNALGRKSPGIVKARFRRKDGNEIFVLIYLSPLNPDDMNAGIVGVVQDITASKRAEQTIMKNEALLRSIFEASPAGIILLVNRIFVKVNNALTVITGYSEDELLGKSTRMLYFNDDDFANVGQIYKDLERHSPGVVESRFRRKDAAEISVLICLSPLNPLDFSAGIVATVLDITNIKRAEKTIKENEALLGSIFDASPAGIGLLQDRIFVKVNNALTVITGYSEDELLGKSTRMLYFNDDEFMRTLDVYEDLKRKNVVMTELRLRCKNGTEIYVLICMSPLNPADLSSGVVATVLDITDRKKMEHEKKHLEEMLLHSQKLESIGRLAGGIAHDFNNMLTAILGNAEMIKEELPPSSNTHVQLEIIERAAESAANLTRQLLAFSRKQIITPRVINLNTSIENIRKMLFTLLGESIGIHLSTDPGLHTILADPGQIEQIMLNLTVNARDAMPSGGKLFIETKNVMLDEAYSHTHFNVVSGPYVMLAITDTGTGMNKETIEHCFEPFFTTKEKGKGTGLGLATVYGNVNQIGGTIELYSEPGKGTTFKIYFPVIKEVPGEEEPLPAPAATLTGTETILIAEDNAMVLKFCSDVLKNAGYNILTAATGEEALTIGQQCNKKIHLLITDVILPGINGRTTSNNLSEIHPGFRTLYTSGYTAEVIDNQGVLEPGIEFISKPFTSRELLAKVRSILDRM